MTDKGKIIEIRDVLKNEFQRFASISTVLKDTSDQFNKIDDTYTSYGSEMDTAKLHINKLKRREFFENLFIYIGLCFFFLCVIYVMLKRFPLHRIIYFMVDILHLAYSSGEFVVKNIIIEKLGKSHSYSYNHTINTNNTSNSSIKFNNTEL